MEKITFKQFVRLMTSQAYFVWNKLEDVEEKEEEGLKFDLPSFIDVIPQSFSEIQSKSFGKIEKAMQDTFDNDKTHFITSKSIDDKIIETNKEISNDKVDIIYKPVFEYVYKDYQVIASPLYYDKKFKTVGFMKISSSTKLKDLLPIVFDSMIVEKNKIEIKNIDISILATKKYNKNEIHFYKSDTVALVKSGRKADKNEYTFEDDQALKSGKGNTKSSNPHYSKTLFDIFNEKGFVDRKTNIQFSDLDYYLNKIIDAKNINNISEANSNDLTDWGFNPDWNALLVESNNEWAGFSGKVISKKKIIERASKHEFDDDSIVGKILNNKKHVDKDEVNKFIKDLENKVIWYDFEAFSLPFSPMDNVMPFHQVVSQVSIIQTNHLKEIAVENIVIDPLHISLDDFVIIIESIYRKDHKYVVYNKGYENTRLQEMLKYLKLKNHHKYDEAKDMVNDIVENTIDLADLFMPRGKNNLPPVFIPELKGFYSIKLIEKYITKHMPNLPYKIKEYKDLDVKNGSMAMDIANQRAMGIIGDNAWEEIKEKLKEYCENDVRVMIMILYFLKELVK